MKLHVAAEYPSRHPPLPNIEKRTCGSLQLKKRLKVGKGRLLIGKLGKTHKLASGQRVFNFSFVTVWPEAAAWTTRLGPMSGPSKFGLIVFVEIWLAQCRWLVEFRSLRSVCVRVCACACECVYNIQAVLNFSVEPNNLFFHFLSPSLSKLLWELTITQLLCPEVFMLPHIYIYV